MGSFAIRSQVGASEISGSGTANYIPKFTGAQTIGNSTVTDDGTYVMVGTNLLSVRASDGRIVSNFPQSGLAGVTFGHAFASPAGTTLAFSVGSSGLTSSFFEVYNTGAFQLGNISGPVSRFGYDGVAGYYLLGSSVSNFGINVYPALALLHSQGTTEQFRAAYNSSNYMSVTVGSTGSTTLNLTGTTPLFAFSKGIILPAGTSTASTAPLKFTSGTNLTTAEAGAVEFTTDDFYLTGTTGTTRKVIRDLSYRSITALRTLDGSDELVEITSGTFAVTLPTAVGYNKQYTIKNSGSGVITLNTTSSQTIDGNASGTVTLIQYDSLVLRSNGANWIIIG